VAPVGSLAFLAAMMLGYYVYMTFNSVLPPERFHRLTIGQDRATVETVLPSRELLDGPSEGGPPAPAGSACHYFRPDADLLGLGRVYRLCFAGDRLVAKDDIPTGPPEPTSRNGG
jgi:hypothetical protein